MESRLWIKGIRIHAHAALLSDINHLDVEAGVEAHRLVYHVSHWQLVSRPREGVYAKIEFSLLWFILTVFLLDHQSLHTFNTTSTLFGHCVSSSQCVVITGSRKQLQ